MNTAVGIDISKGKSVVAAVRSFGEVALPLREFIHTSEDLSALTEMLRLIEGNTHVILEATGRYHEPAVMALQKAGFFVSAVNPKLIKDFGNNSLRKVKTDKAEFIRLAATLPEYEVVRTMYGVDNVIGAQLIAEIGDVRRFANRGVLIAFAGVDPGVNESDKHSAQSVRTGKRGLLHLRKPLAKRTLEDR